MDDSVVRSRIDSAVKEEARRILKNMGITLSDGIRLFLHQVIADQALPFSVRMPNKKTIEAMEAARRGETETVTLEDLAEEWKASECEK